MTRQDKILQQMYAKVLVGAETFCNVGAADEVVLHESKIVKTCVNQGSKEMPSAAVTPLLMLKSDVHCHLCVGLSAWPQSHAKHSAWNANMSTVQL